MRLNQLELISKWFKSQEVLDKAKREELELRNQVIEALFYKRKEGVNTIVLPKADGDEITYALKCDHRINRAIDIPALTNMTDALKEAGINIDVLIRYKPELNVTDYKKLGDVHRHLFDQCLIIKDGQAGLSITEKKR